MHSSATLTVHGARGSMPVSGPSTVRYGGRTTCFGVDLGAGEPVIIDCGTGLALAEALHPTEPTRLHIFLSHFHLDHLIGLHVYRPLFEAGYHLVFHGRPPPGHTLEEMVAAPFSGSLFPVPFADTSSEKTFVTIGDDPIQVGALTVTPIPLRHPQGGTGYRLDHHGRSVVIATDHEAGDPEIDGHLAELASGAGTLIHDAQYTPDEYSDRRQGWGHSTWRHAVDAATAAGVNRLLLTSHDPFRGDDELDTIVKEASHHFADVAAAYEGLAIPL